MAQHEIIRKLDKEFGSGITTEAQVVYAMAGIRKLLEQQEAKPQYEYLTFHCDWALHSKLQGRMTQKILAAFDAANIHLKQGLTLSDLPPGLGREVEDISKMRCFEEEFDEFLNINGLAAWGASDPDAWVNFVQLYARVVEDCPLVMTPSNTTASIEKLTLHLEFAEKPIESDLLFRVIWRLLDKNGKSGQIFILFSMTPVQRPNIIRHSL